MLACILRAACAAASGMLDVWDKADSAFVSAYRKHHDRGFDIEVECLGAPSVAGRQLVLVDPMLATGASLQAAYDALCEHGAPDRLHVVSAIASRDGLRNAQAWLQKERPSLWVAWTPPWTGGTSCRGWGTPAIWPLGPKREADHPAIQINWN